MPWNKTFIFSKEDLERLYLIEKKDSREIAKIYGCSLNLVIKTIHDFKISVRNKSEAAILNNIKHPKTKEFGYKISRSRLNGMVKTGKLYKIDSTDGYKFKQR